MPTQSSKRRARAPDVAGRKELYAQLTELLQSDGPVAIYWVANHINAYRKSVNNFHSWPDFRVRCEEIWLS